MDKITIPKEYNYLAVFLTFVCNLKCSYCINHQFNAYPQYKQLNGKEWVQYLSRIVTRPDLPISLQGGEPTLHPDFYYIINNLPKDLNIDVLTNAQFNEDYFMDSIPPERLKRESPYASIRASWHPEQMELEPLLEKIKKMQNKGYSVGIWAILHPRWQRIVKAAQEIAQKEGIDFRTKEFLGMYNGKMYGTYKYSQAVDGIPKKCECKPSEMLVAPNGNIHRCHSDLYNNRISYANIADEKVGLLTDYKHCIYMGLCNSCDVKLKTDRFQQSNWCSTEIKC